jgi:hypothetical protein
LVAWPSRAGPFRNTEPITALLRFPCELVYQPLGEALLTPPPLENYVLALRRRVKLPPRGAHMRGVLRSQARPTMAVADKGLVEAP